MRRMLSLVWFYIGLLICVFGYAMVIKPGVGAAPWDIFHLGLSGVTGVQLQFVVQGTGVVIIALNLVMGIRPSVGMLLNMLSVGPMLQRALVVVPQPETMAGRWAMLLGGILVAGIGTALYVSADIGSGPRDGMMIGLTRRLGLPVALIKNVMDVTVAVIGWRLGGPLWAGTVLVALGLGPSMQLGMNLVARLSERAPFSGFVHPVALKR